MGGVGFAIFIYHRRNLFGMGRESWRRELRIRDGNRPNRDRRSNYRNHFSPAIRWQSRGQPSHVPLARKYPSKMSKRFVINRSLTRAIHGVRTFFLFACSSPLGVRKSRRTKRGSRNKKIGEKIRFEYTRVIVIIV